MAAAAAAAAAAAGGAGPQPGFPAAEHDLPAQTVNQIGEAWLVSRPDAALHPVLAARYAAPDAPYSPGTIGFWDTAPMGAAAVAAAAAGLPPPQGGGAWIPPGRVMTAGPRSAEIGPVATTFLDTSTETVPLRAYHVYLDPHSDSTTGEVPLPPGFPAATPRMARALFWLERLDEGRAELQARMLLGLPLDPLGVTLAVYHAAGMDAPLDAPDVALTPGARSGGQALGEGTFNAALAMLSPGDAWWGPRAWLLRVAAHMGDGTAAARSNLLIGYSHVTFADGGEHKWFQPNLVTMRTFLDAARLTGDNLRGAHVHYLPGWAPGVPAPNGRYVRATTIQCSRAWPGTRTVITSCVSFVFTNSLSVLLAMLGFTTSMAGGVLASRTPPPVFCDWVRSAGCLFEDLRVLGFGLLVTDGCARMTCQQMFRSSFRLHPPHANLGALPGVPGIDSLPHGEHGAVHYLSFANTCLELVELLHDVCERLGMPVCTPYLLHAAGPKLIMGVMRNSKDLFSVECIDVHRPELGSVMWPALFF